MGWIPSLGVAVLTALAALIGAGTIAGLAVDWYEISSFEGGSGFFVVAMSLLGGLSGLVLGLVAARVTASRPRPTFLKALGSSLGLVAASLLLIAGAAWMAADIPPQIDGEELFLLTEVRWPASGAMAPASMTVAPYLRIGALSGAVARRMERGVLFMEDARQENGRWIVPGAVPVFTSRGGRLLDFGAGQQSMAGFLVPLPRYPGQAQREWSGWLPAARPGDPGLPDQFTYRFKVIRHSEPLRTETIGRFDVDTIADYFYEVSDAASRPAASATFRVRYRGQPIPGVPVAQTVAIVGGLKPSLFVTTDPGEDGPCALLLDEGTMVRVQRVTGCVTPVTERLLTSDQARFTAAKRHQRLSGWIDRTSFAEPGLFQMGAAIVDTRSLTVTGLPSPQEVRPDNGVPPLDLAPDERSFVWLAQGPEHTPRLGVTNWRTSESYVLPIDRARMRYNTASELDPEWLQHHFEWRRAAAGGADILVERATFLPLPHHGDLTLGKPGEYQGYTLRPGGEPLRTAVVELLVRELGGERLPDDAGGFLQRVRVNGRILNVSVIGSPTYVNVSMDPAGSDPQVMAAFAARLDTALATGSYDALFVSPEEAK